MLARIRTTVEIVLQL